MTTNTKPAQGPESTRLGRREDRDPLAGDQAREAQMHSVQIGCQEKSDMTVPYER